MKWSIRHRFEAGHFLCPTNNLLGYMTVDDQMVIEPEGAKTVRLIYYMFLAGYTAMDIAERMTSAKRRTGWLRKDIDGNDIYNTRWSSSSVMNILRNEKYSGDIRAQKTFTVSYLTHEKRKNSGEMPSYWQDDHHEGIVSREVYALAQKIIASNRYNSRNSSYSLSLSVISEGLLRGFVPLNRAWAGSELEEYRGVSDTVCWGKTQLRSVRLSPIHQFEVLRSEYTKNQITPTLTITEKHIVANTYCRSVMGNVEFVEFLLHPRERLLAIRAASSEQSNAIRWAESHNEATRTLPFTAGVIPRLLYEMMNWESGWKFKAKGQYRINGNETILIFSLAETVAYIPIMQLNQYGEDQFIGWNPPIFPYEWNSQLVGPSLISSLTSARMHLFDFFGEWDVQSNATKPEAFARKRPLSKDEIQAAIEALDPETL
ncbi:MAG: recombinase family protein [Parabacteroides sp.]|nr:recombinase family protein [Parabacteroides sp.]